MELREYSNLDLLGKLVLFTKPTSFFERLSSAFSKTYSFNASISMITFLKTDSYRRYMKKEFDVLLTTGQFVSVLYIDFMNRYERTNNIKWAYDFLRSTEPPSKITINNHMQNEIYVIDENERIQKKKLWVQIDKDVAINGEILLKEIDDKFGYYLKLEDLIERVWERFFLDRKEKSVKKIISDFGDMIANQ